MKTEQYILTRICKCGYKEEFPLNRLEAAFGFPENKFWKMICPQCGKSQTDSVSYNTPKIDSDLFKIWSENENYQFSEQDEDILLAEMDYLELLLSAFDDKNFPIEKKVIVINALCVLLFDNIKLKGEKYTEDEKHRMEVNRNIVLPELQKRRDAIFNYKSVIWDYVWEEIEHFFNKDIEPISI